MSDPQPPPRRKPRPYPRRSPPATDVPPPPPPPAPAPAPPAPPPEPPEPPPDPPPAQRGPELARAVLDAANARRQAGTGTGRRGGKGSQAKRAGGGAARRRGWSGPGPDQRDPQPFGAVLAKLVKTRGWQQPAAEATVFGQWDRVVGPQVAEHCHPVKLEDGVLTVEAVSTAWATQLRLLAGRLLKQIAAEVGHNVVTRLHIHGPAAPSWNRGRRRVRGRGPRDTYG